MLRIGLKILFGDAVKLLGLVAGIAFSTLLMAQQGGFLIGLISRSANVIAEASGVDIWVMDPLTETVESPRALRETDVLRVRGVEGVATAVPFLQAVGTIRSGEGETTSAALLGVDDATLRRRPPRGPAPARCHRARPALLLAALAGRSHRPGASRGDQRAAHRHRRDHRRRPGLRRPRRGLRAPLGGGRDRGRGPATSFVLVQVVQATDPGEVAAAIEAQTGLRALPADGFRRATIDVILANTGIAFSFGVVIALGAVVGILVAGLTFSLFVNENIRQFALLKAVGPSNGRIVLMVLGQALTVAGIGYSFGLWVASSFFDSVNQPLSDLKGFYLPWQVAALVGVATVGIVVLATLVSLRRVLSLDPAVVFRS